MGSLPSFANLNAVAIGGIQNLPVISNRQNIPRPAKIPFTRFNSAATNGIKNIPALSGSLTETSFNSLNDPQQLVASAQIKETPLLSEVISTRTSVPRPSTPLIRINNKLEYLENLQLNGNSLLDF